MRKEASTTIACCSTDEIGRVGSAKRRSAKVGSNTQKNHVDKMFRAFSDRKRLRILNILRGGETCVCDLVQILGIPQPTASRHLGYLRRAGLVMARRDGLWQHYSLAPARGAFHRKLLDCLRHCFHEVPELGADAEKAKRMRRAGNCCR